MHVSLIVSRCVNKYIKNNFKNHRKHEITEISRCKRIVLELKEDQTYKHCEQCVHKNDAENSAKAGDEHGNKY